MFQIRDTLKKDDFSQRLISVLILLFPVVAIIFPRSLFYLAFIPGIMMFAYQLYFRKHNNYIHDFVPLFKIIFLLAGLFMVNALFSILPFETINRGTKLGLILSGAFLSWLGYKNFNHKLQHRASYIICAGFILSVFVISIDMSFGLPLLNFIGYGGENAFPHIYNRSLVVITLFTLPCLYLLKGRYAPIQRRDYSVAILLLILSLYAIAISSSQSAQLAVFASFGAMCIYLFFKERGEKYFWLLLKVGIISCIVLAPVICKLLFEYIVQNPELLETYMLQKGAAAARLEIWNALSELISQKPITGYGANTTRELTLPTENIFRNYKTILHPHNFAMQIWLELGLIGVLVSSYIFWRVIGFIENISEFALRFSALGVFVAWIAIAAVGYGMWQSWWVGLTLTLVLFYALMNKNNIKD